MRTLALLLPLLLAVPAIASEHPKPPLHMTWPTLDNGDETDAMRELNGCGDPSTEAAQKAKAAGRIDCKAR